jgi:hypothetical protein
LYPNGKIGLIGIMMVIMTGATVVMAQDIKISIYRNK